LSIGRPGVGLDLGGTKTLAVVVAPDGQVLGQSLHPTPHGSRQDLVAALERAVSEACRAAGVALKDTVGVGIGVPGPTDPGTGVLLEAPNLAADDQNLPLREMLQPVFGVPVAVENDANAAALGEHRFGAGRGADDMIYITISTGIGGGLILGGQLAHGAGFTAGEVGHMVLAPEGRDVCGCGRTGCWESICSGTGMARQGRAAIADGRAPGLAAKATAQADGITPALLVAAAADGDPTAAAIIARAVTYNGVALMNLIHILSPALIVIGGGLTHAWDQVIAPGVRWALDHALRRPASSCRIVPAQLGSLCGGLGAAALVLPPAAD
jgi:glucokinase